MSKRAAIYVRVSTDEQADKGYSLPSQVEACKKFSEQKGFELVGVYQDDISGAIPIANRPDGRQLQDAIIAGQIQAVIVYQVDRLSRDIVDLLATVRQWLQNGVEVYALDVGQIKSELDIVFVIRGWQGSDERKRIAERTSRGRSAKARAGKVVGVGPRPYGYKYLDGELIIHEPEAQVVEQIFNWYVVGDENGKMLSIKKIAILLTDIGIPTPSESKGWARKNGREGIWDISSVNWILSNETYCGIWRYGKSIGKNGKAGNRPIEEQIKVEVPAIVSQGIWNSVQERKKFNSSIAKRKTKRNYLLRGLIKCGCGRNLVGSKGRYICSGRYDYSLEIQCQEPVVYSQVIEHVVWEYVIDLITNPDQFEKRLQIAQKEEMHVKQPKITELEHVTALIVQTEDEADKIAQAMIRTGGIVADRLKEQAKEVEKRFQALMTRKIKIEKELTIRELTDQNIQNMLEFREIVATGLQNPTFDDMRIWLEVLRVQVTVDNQIAIITCRLPGNPVEVDLVPPKNGNSGNGDGSFEFSITGNIGSTIVAPAVLPGHPHPDHVPVSNYHAQLPNRPFAS